MRKVHTVLLTCSQVVKSVDLGNATAQKVNMTVDLGHEGCGQVLYSLPSYTLTIESKQVGVLGL